MKVWRGLADLPSFPGGTAVAVGNFDGLHLGHQRILGRITAAAERRRLFPLVLTFFPHPAKAFCRSDVPLIQTFEQRLKALERTGIKGVLVVPLTRSFAALSGPDFARGYLQKALNAREVVVGADFRFGKDRRWDIRSLERLGRESGFAVHASVPVKRAGRVVSSSLIRRLLGEGRVAEVRRLLGRPFEIRGPVIKGKGRGQMIGFPTANIAAENEILPPGVFLTETEIGTEVYPSLTNIGTLPTFGENPVSVETHIPGFDGRLYKRVLTIRFLKRLRNEKIFSSPEALAAQIRSDILRIRVQPAPGRRDNRD